MWKIAFALLACAPAAHAFEWTGMWRADGTDVLRRVRADSGKLFMEFKVDDGDRVRIEGGATGSRLVLVGKSGTPGLAGALDGERVAHHEVALIAEGEDGKDERVARVRLVVDGKERRETWRLGASRLELLDLSSGGETLSEKSELAPRRGLVVRFAVRRAALAVKARIEVAAGHPFVRFYDFLPRRGDVRVLHEIDLGARAPGEHSWTWDARDPSTAKRLALPGNYKVVLEGTLELGGSTTKVEISETFRVASPIFSVLGSSWPGELEEDGLPWNPTRIFPELARNLARTPGRQRGYEARTDPISKGSEAQEAFTSSAGVLVDTHGNPGQFGFYDPAELPKKRSGFWPSSEKGAYKDVLFAVVTSCNSGRDTDGKSLVEKLVEGGCDVAIGFRGEVIEGETPIFERQLLALLGRGSPIEAAARDAARISYVEFWAAPGITDEEIDRLIEEGQRKERGKLEKTPMAFGMTVARAGREDESLWPPRHGNSTN